MQSQKIIFTAIYKNCDGKKIDKCKDCNYIYKPIKSYACGKAQVQIKNINTIPSWCLLRNWNEGKYGSK